MNDRIEAAFGDGQPSRVRHGQRQLWSAPVSDLAATYTLQDGRYRLTSGSAPPGFEW